MKGYSKRRLQKLIFTLVLAGVVALIGSHGKLGQKATQGAQQNDPGLYSVNHFVDGDTIAVNMNGSVETIRLIGVDTPETHKPNTPVQCYGPEAAAYTKQLIGDSKVRLQADPDNTNRDRYGRLLRYVYLPDGRLVETELITKGYGFAYTLFPFQKKDEFKADEQQAKTASLGLWANCQVKVEASGREQTNNQSTP